MGIYTDILADGTQFPTAAPSIGNDRSSRHQLEARLSRADASIATAYAAANEVTTIPEQTDAGAADTYILTIQFFGALAGTTISTAAIAYNAVDTVIETAIDVAAAGLAGWTNGDITVAMVGAAGLDDGAVSLTFDGTSVDATPAVVTLAATGFTATTPIVRTTGGSGDRKALQALFELNVVSGSVHQAGAAPTDWVKPGSTGQTRPRSGLIKDLALLASVEDGTDEIYDAVKTIYPSI